MIRKIKQEDFSRCVAIVNSVWKFTEIFKPDELAKLFLDVYTLGSLSGRKCIHRKLGCHMSMNYR